MFSLGRVSYCLILSVFPGMALTTACESWGSDAVYQCPVCGRAEMAHKRRSPDFAYSGTVHPSPSITVTCLSVAEKL